MSSQTITGTISSGVTLTADSTTIASTALLTTGPNVSAAVYGYLSDSTALALTNYGTLIGSNFETLVFQNTFGDSAVAGTIVNESGGLIDGSGGGYGVLSYGAATIDNDAGGTIDGSIYAIGVQADLATITNGGLLQCTGTAAIIEIGTSSASPLSAVNQTGGTITSSGYGIYLEASDHESVVNQVGGTITGEVVLDSGGTLTNAGVIAGVSGAPAVGFLATSAPIRLIADPGAIFTGGITAEASNSSNTMELAVGNSGTGSLTGFGTSVTNFNTIDFDSGATWSISGNASGLLGTINGFTGPDSIDLTGFVAVSRTFASNALVLTNSSNSHATLNIHGNFVTADFTITSANGGTGTLITACFASGTRIRTTRGDVEVSELRDGDMIVGLDGEHLPVIWLGHRRVDCARHPRPWDVWPVRVAAHAFGPNRPERDLRLSPDHAVFVADATAGGVLIPVRYLINGATVVQEAADEVVYWHVELPRHAVLLADGLPCESYLDTGNRAAFDNAGDVVTLHAKFATPDWTPEEHARRTWDTEACARLVCSGPEVAAARRRLIARLPSLGHAIAADPALRIVVDGAEVPAQRDGTALCVALPDDAAELRLVSRTAAPAELDPLSGDTRRLGVAVAWLALDGEAVTLSDRRLGRGWLAPEPGVRWTTGDGAIDVRGATVVELRLAPIALLFHHTDRREPAPLARAA